MVAVASLLCCKGCRQVRLFDFLRAGRQSASAGVSMTMLVAAACPASWEGTRTPECHTVCRCISLSLDGSTSPARGAAPYDVHHGREGGATIHLYGIRGYFLRFVK